MAESEGKTEETAASEELALAAEFSPGTRFESRFELQELLGKGATGSAYKARDVLLDRIVAIKILHSFLLANPRAVERFKQEAMAGSSLLHPGIARVYSQALSEDGRLYLVMDYLEGTSLADILKQKGKLPLDRFFSLFSQIIDALNFAHENNIVHRDIKPSNIMIVKEQDKERAVIVDFGIAKLIGQASEQSSTQTGAMLGSSNYMSPEQCIGKEDADARSDIYSLGCVMLECLTGRTPFSGDSALDTMYKHINESLAKLGFLKDIPEAISKMLSKCLQKDPSQRYQKLGELKVDFQKCENSQDTLNRRWKRKNQVKQINTNLRIASVVCLLGLSVFAYHQYNAWQAKNSLRSVEQVNQEIKTPHALPPPEAVKLVAGEENIKQKYYQYADRHLDKEGTILLKRWEAKFGNDSSAPIEAKVFVYSSLVQALVKQKEFEQANALLTKLEEFGKSNLKIATVSAIGRANMYRFLGTPKKGIIEIEKLINARKKELSVHPGIYSELELLEAEASCYMDQADYVNARRIYLQAIKDADKNSQSVHIEQRLKLRCPAIIPLTMLNDPLAAKYETDIATLSPDPSFASGCYFNIANAFIKLGELEKFEKWQRLAIAGSKGIMPPEQQWSTLVRMADLYRDYGQYDLSLKLTNELLDAEKKNSISRRLSLMSRISIVYMKTKDFARLKENEEQVFRYMQDELKKDPSFLWKQASNEYSFALSILTGSPIFDKTRVAKLCQEIIEQVEAHDPLSIVLLSLYTAASDCARVQNNPAEQKKYQEKYIQLALQQKSIDLLADSLRIQGELAFSQKEHEKAAACFKQALELPKESVAAVRRHGIEYRYSEVLEAMGKKDESLRLRAELEKELLSQDTGGLPSAEDLGITQTMAMQERERGNNHQWELLTRKAISDLSLAYGNNVTLLPLISSLAYTLQLQKKYAESDQILARAFQICRKWKIKDDPVYMQLSRQAAYSYFERNNFPEAEKYIKEALAHNTSKSIAEELLGLRKRMDESKH